MERVRAYVGKSAARAGQHEAGESVPLSAAARLDCLYCLLGTVALYYGFGALDERGISSPASAGFLFFSPIIVGMLLGLRGHVLPLRMHVYFGAVNAMATIGPLLAIRAEAELLRLSWWSIAQVVLLLGVIAFPAALCSLAGVGLGGLVRRFSCVHILRAATGRSRGLVSTSGLAHGKLTCAMGWRGER
jgi:hypothetical protein